MVCTVPIYIWPKFQRCFALECFLIFFTYFYRTFVANLKLNFYVTNYVNEINNLLFTTESEESNIHTVYGLVIHTYWYRKQLVVFGSLVVSWKYCVSTRDDKMLSLLWLFSLGFSAYFHWRLRVLLFAITAFCHRVSGEKTTFV